MIKKNQCRNCGFINEDELTSGVRKAITYHSKEEYDAATHPESSTICRCKRCSFFYAIDQFFAELPEPYSTPNHCDPLV